jgi:succinyl-diaminopimelate desuccinylase
MAPSSELVSLLSELVRIPSQNPMGNEIPGDPVSNRGDWYEYGMADFVEKWLLNHGFEPFRMECGDRRANILTRLEGSDGSPVMLWDAHMDTVPVAGMTIAPFDPVQQDGKLFGRGACDVKGGLAVMMTAFFELSKFEKQRRPTVILCCSCDEEFGQLGMKGLVKHLDNTPGRTAIPFAIDPALAIVAEPTDLDVVVAHMGVTRWKIVVEGTPAHSSSPTRGVNAIYRMSRLIGHLEQHAMELGYRQEHPLCGGPSLSVGRIQGGTSVNVVPARCEIEIDRRIAPGESCDGAIEEVENLLKAQLDVPFAMEPAWCKHAPFQDDVNANLASNILASAKKYHPASTSKGVRFGTHATNFSSRGIPTVVFGPGSIQQAHTNDEWIEIEQLVKANSILVDFAKSSIDR